VAALFSSIAKRAATLPQRRGSLGLGDPFSAARSAVRSDTSPLGRETVGSSTADNPGQIVAVEATDQRAGGLDGGLQGRGPRRPVDPSAGSSSRNCRARSRPPRARRQPGQPSAGRARASSTSRINSVRNQQDQPSLICLRALSRGSSRWKNISVETGAAVS